MTSLERLHAFIADMLQWETTFHAKRRSQEYRQNAALREQSDKEAKEKLENIFKEYLSMNALETRAKGRLDLLNTGQPPEFAQRVLNDTECKVGKVVYIEALNEKDLAPHRRYAIVMENDVPKIDAVFSRLNEGAKWGKRHSI
ncbi:hypothetical protein G3O06_01715 [Burkholderia sp. Ac-20345]|uniref:NTF2 fold immunity protein n=1 Tax=Burkholderia sp. Ac-20345 TaxID=2703891 RepID=UPI00197BF03D|nr:NTF2 fold immunity protein [Burkholderia sp. Ac-20345]MBN3776279.1 hypothetical protein [Burkholderia sp. Ac-20345]